MNKFLLVIIKEVGFIFLQISIFKYFTKENLN